MKTNWTLLSDGVNYGAEDVSTDGAVAVHVETFGMTNERGATCYGLRATINGSGYAVHGSFYRSDDWMALACELIESVIAERVVPEFCTPCV